MKNSFLGICLSIIGFLNFFSFTYSQGVAIGQWREHLPYNKIISVAVSENDVFAATEYAIIKYNKNEDKTYRLSKINALSDVGITKIAYSNILNVLVVAYRNGNIDFIQNNTVINFGDIKRSTISDNKKINNIEIFGTYAYLSCSFGIVKLDLEKREIKDTYIIGANGTMTEVYDIAFFQDKIFAATKSGLMYAGKNNPNLVDFSVWQTENIISRAGYVCNLVHTFQDKLFANITKNVWDTDTMFLFQNNSWNIFSEIGYSNRKQIKSYSNQLIIAQPAGIFMYDSALQETGRIWDLGIGFVVPNDMEREPSDSTIYWIGEDNNGLIKNINFWTNEYFSPFGPYTNKVYSLFSDKNNILGVPGARDISWNNTYTPGGIYSFNNEQWLNITNKDIPEFDTLYDFLSAVSDPVVDGHWYIGSFGKGIIEIDNGALVKVWNGLNTSFTGTAGNPKDVRVSGLKYDSNGNLWISASYSNKCLSVRTSSGSWYSYYIPVVTSGDVFSCIVIDNYGNKWMSMPKGGGIVVYNENNTFANTSDDKYIKLSTNVGDGNLPSMRVLSLALDKEGRIWAGTDKGIAVFYYPQNLFTTENYDAQQILVEIGGYVQPLLESETVNCIYIDGANRKWIGTEKAGVFLLSADGLSQVEHFTEENSPLISNTVNTIAIHPTTGEVFFGTSLGIVSFKGTATEGVPSYDTQAEKVYVYPNPVKPDYKGYIAVKNLVTDSMVKITDIYGNLIYQTQALGGQMVWDGSLPDGSKPQSGVFLVFASNSDGSETLVTKILFIR